MKQWIILGAALTISHAAWAEGNLNDMYTSAASSVDIYATAGATRATAITTPPMVTPATITAPSLSKEDNAALHLSIIRDEVDAIKSSGFLGNLFSVDEALQSTLSQDIDLFLSIYADLPITAEALYLKGQMLHKKKQPEAATVLWLQTIYEFPQSDAARHAKTSLESLTERDWTDYAKDIKAIMNEAPEGNVPARLSVLITKLYPLDDSELIAALRLLQFDFLKRFPNDAHADEVQVLMAHNIGAESARGGIFGFRKLLALYPNSAYRAEAMLAIADLQRSRLKSYDKAESNYKVLIREYPDHVLIKHAYENLAFTQAEHLEKYQDAIQTYTIIHEKYKDEPLGLTALQNIAKLQIKRTDEPVKAVATLRKIAKLYKGGEAVDALSAASKIAKKKLKDPALSYEINTQLVQDYPDTEDAADALFSMAEYTEETLKDKAKAKALYEQLIQQYPKEKRLVRKARARI